MSISLFLGIWGLSSSILTVLFILFLLLIRYKRPRTGHVWLLLSAGVFPILQMIVPTLLFLAWFPQVVKNLWAFMWLMILMFSVPTLGPMIAWHYFLKRYPTARIAKAWYAGAPTTRAGPQSTRCATSETTAQARFPWWIVVFFLVGFQILGGVISGRCQTRHPAYVLYGAGIGLVVGWSLAAIVHRAARRRRGEMGT